MQNGYFLEINTHLAIVCFQLCQLGIRQNSAIFFVCELAAAGFLVFEISVLNTFTRVCSVLLLSNSGTLEPIEGEFGGAADGHGGIWIKI